MTYSNRKSIQKNFSLNVITQFQIEEKKINATIAQEREKFKLVDTSSIEERLPLLRELLTNYHSLSAAEKNSILKNFVKKIEYKREKSAPEGDIFLKIYYK